MGSLHSFATSAGLVAMISATTWSRFGDDIEKRGERRRERAVRLGQSLCSTSQRVRSTLRALRYSASSYFALCADEYRVRRSLSAPRLTAHFVHCLISRPPSCPRNTNSPSNHTASTFPSRTYKAHGAARSALLDLYLPPNLPDEEPSQRPSVSQRRLEAYPGGGGMKPGGGGA